GGGGMRYYPIARRWTKRIAPHLEDPAVQKVLVRDLNKFTWGRRRKKFLPGMTPHEFESCDWWLGHRGPLPRFWHYVKHAACHWLVNDTVRLAERAEPRVEWRIVTSENHSTVWDGGEVLFDMNFLALGVPPEKAWQLASEGGKVLPVGKERRCYLVEHYSHEVRRLREG